MLRTVGAASHLLIQPIHHVLHHVELQQPGVREHLVLADQWRGTPDLAADAPSEILRTAFERAHATANLRHRMARGGVRGRVPQRVHDVIHHAFACLHAHVLLRRIIQRVHFQFGEQTLEIVLLPVQRLDLQPLQSLGVGFPDALLQSRDALRIRLDDHEHRAAVLIVDSPRQLLDGLA